jgi:hypothetical protein
MHLLLVNNCLGYMFVNTVKRLLENTAHFLIRNLTLLTRCFATIIQSATSTNQRAWKQKKGREANIHS